MHGGRHRGRTEKTRDEAGQTRLLSVSSTPIGWRDREPDNVAVQEKGCKITMMLISSLFITLAVSVT